MTAPSSGRATGALAAGLLGLALLTACSSGAGDPDQPGAGSSVVTGGPTDASVAPSRAPSVLREGATGGTDGPARPSSVGTDLREPLVEPQVPSCRRTEDGTRVQAVVVVTVPPNVRVAAEQGRWTSARAVQEAAGRWAVVLELRSKGDEPPSRLPPVVLAIGSGEKTVSLDSRWSGRCGSEPEPGRASRR